MGPTTQSRWYVSPPVHAGRASVWIGIISLLSWIGVIVIGCTVHATFGRAKVDSPIYYALGVWVVVTLLMTLFGLVLAIAGVWARHRASRCTAVAGMMLNLALPIGILLLTVLALLVDPSPQPILTPNDPDRPTPRSLATGGAVLVSCAAGVFLLLRRIVSKPESSMELAFAPEVFALAQREHVTTVDAMPTSLPVPPIRCGTCPQMLPANAGFCRRCGTRVERHDARPAN